MVLMAEVCVITCSLMKICLCNIYLELTANMNGNSQCLLLTVFAKTRILIKQKYVHLVS